jgi:hypothetical protein
MAFINGNRKSRKNSIQSLKCHNNRKSVMTSKLFDILFDHQLEAYYIGIMRNGKCILADKSGKSLEAIAIMAHFYGDWPLIIVCESERKIYWKIELEKWLSNQHSFDIKIVEQISHIYSYPNPSHDIIIIDYTLYYEIKDTISFKLLNIESYILEDKSRGKETHLRQWRGLSKCFDNLKIAKRVCFIWSKEVNLNDPNRLFPTLNILDSDTFGPYGRFYERYCKEDDKDLNYNKELELLLRATLLIKNIPDIN